MKTIILLTFLLSPYLYSQVDYGTVPINKMPELIGGLDSLQSRLQYPDSALSRKTEGKVYVKVTIDTTGKPTHPVILKGLSSDCNEEAIELVMSSHFSPAQLRDKPITFPIVIPVKFKLPK